MNSAQTRRLAFGEHGLHLRTGGHGEVLWLVHGFPTSGRDWSALWPSLARSYRLHALDMLGFGQSDKPVDFAYSIPAAADQWVALAQAEQLTEVRLLAHDYGNTVAQELLARQRDGRLPFRIQAVVFLNGGLFPEATFPLPIQRWLAGPLGPLLARLSSQRRFAASMQQICRQPWPVGEMEEAWQLLVRAGGRRCMPALLGYIRERSTHRERWLGALQQAGIALALINGVEDPISGRSIVTRWRELLPASSVIELAGIGHYPQLEAPQQVLDGLARLWS